MRLLRTGALLISCLLVAATSLQCQPSAPQKPAKPTNIKSVLLRLLSLHLLFIDKNLAKQEGGEEK